MKIENQAAAPVMPARASTVGGKQAGTFQAILSAQAQARSVGDSFSPAKTAATPSTTILPTDSDKVKMEKLKEIDASFDYSGMSYQEIHSTIYNRYNAAFNGNLLGIVSFGGDDWTQINLQYQDEIKRHVYYPMRNELAAKLGMKASDEQFQNEYFAPQYREIRWTTLGYRGMSFEEREASIMKKYQGKDTFMDVLNMHGELRSSGVLAHKMGVEGADRFWSQFLSQIDYDYFDGAKVGAPAVTQEWINNSLDMPIDLKGLYHNLKDSLSKMSFSNFRSDDWAAFDAMGKGVDSLLEMLDHYWE